VAFFMILVDFIFYYLALYFTKRPQTIARSTPVERASYCLGLITTSWLLAAMFFIKIYVVKSTNLSQGYWMLLIAITIFLIWLYGYIYDSKGRYSFLLNSRKKIFNINAILGMSIAWVILLLSFSCPYIILINSMK